jgi:hypothetical protein
MSWVALLLLAAVAVGLLAAAVVGILWFLWWIERGGNDPPQ